MARVEVDRSLPPVVVPARIVSELLGHARETLPEECCGLIVGTADQRYRRLVRCQNAMTKLHQEDPHQYPRDGSAAFWISGAEYAQVEREADAAGERVTAVYHSHPGTEEYLSEMDLEYAPRSPSIDQIVISFPTTQPDDDPVGRLAVFRWDAEARGFRGRRVRPSVA